ncbi:MAG: hypothetical protein F9K47_12235 [Burkholderiales bacterium]|nr:MAG: hypothetical protein F9K47_12235 [Burkholderiales bacterium]
MKALTLRHSKLLSLKGIETCSQLEELRLLRVKGLRSLDGVEHCTQLRILEIDRGSAPVGVADVLCRLEGLEEVYFEGDFVLEHLRWLVRNRQMRSFRSDAVVIDVDWTKVFESPLLREIAFRHQPGALQRDTDIAQIAASFGRPLKWVEHGGTSKRPWVELHFVGG